MIRSRRIVGKYRVQRLLDRGGFASVWRAQDTVEGIPVALKVPHAHLMSPESLTDFKKEVRLTARLDHPNILPIKTAAFIDDDFVITYPLGKENLGDRLGRRLSTKTALSFAEQLLSALEYAHARRIVHCDVKPENLILFDGDRLRLADFGIAKVAFRTLRGYGTGSIGYVAPEQAFGKPSVRSDVFSAGIVIYRMFTGKLPEWPFEWPFPGHDRLRAKLSPEMIAVIKKAVNTDPKKRFANAGRMLEAFRRASRRAARPAKNGSVSGAKKKKKDWKTVRRRQFERQYKKQLETRLACSRCHGPVSETMRFCPWCKRERKVLRDSVRMPARCKRCKRGVKTDWRFCPWCYGGLIGPLSDREYGDKKYVARCSNKGCERRDLMPWMRYCPWCNTKVKKKWRIEGSDANCKKCGWGVVREYWEFCPWCSASTNGRRAR